MRLNFILGGIDIDKTAQCFSMISQEHKRDLKQKLIMIVPDQFSYSAERQIVERFGGSGMNNIDVLTFSRLSYHIRKELDLPSYLTSSGKQMILYKAILSVNDSDNIFSGCEDKSGFIDEIGDILNEMKRYEITPQILEEQSENVADNILKRKLNTISQIYAEYERLIDGEFSDSDYDLDIVAEYIESSDKFDNSIIWFDEFSDFLPQNYRVIEALIKKAYCVNVTLCIPEKSDVRDDTFDVCRETYSKLKRIAMEIGCETTDIPTNTKISQNRSEEIQFLLDNWNTNNSQCSENVKDISIFQGRDPYSEVEYTACNILKLVRENKMRFSDIGILCGDSNVYNHLIETVFGEYGISYFTDSKVSITNHPIISLVLGIFDVLNNNWKYNDIFAYLRTGFVYYKDENESISPIDIDSVDILENYVLKNGIRGRKHWCGNSIWKIDKGRIFDDAIYENSEENEEGNLIDNFRRQISMPFAKFKSGCRGRHSYRQIATRLFEFLEDIHLPEGIEYEIAKLQSDGKMNEAEQFAKIWNLLIESLDQIVVTMGSEKCTLDEFSSYIKVGLSKCEIRIIPSSIDQVSIASLDRSRLTNVKALFIIGANYGKIPADIKNEGVLNNRDRSELQQKLNEIDMEIAPDTYKKNSSQMYKLYKIISSAYNKLFISYALADTEDDALRPAQFVIDIKDMFEKIIQEDDIIMSKSQDAENICAPKPAFNKLMSRLDAPEDSLWGAVRNWFENDDKWNSRLQRAILMNDSNAKLDKKNAMLLYGENTRGSVTRFEKYAMCPFSYYLEYGLKLRPQEIWELKSLDIGNLCHWIVQNYCNTVSDNGKTIDELKYNWHNLTDEKSTEILNNLIEESTQKILPNLIYDRSKIENIIERISRTVHSSVDIINKTLKNGEYVIAASEKEFELIIQSEKRDIKLVGKIDRVDFFEEDGKAYIRIIDYKSGKKNFDVADIYEKISLQLVTYAIGAAKAYNNKEFLPLQSDKESKVEIDGMFYEKIRDDIFEADNNTREGAIAKSKSEKRLGGIIFADTVEELEKFDKDIIQKSKSDFMRIALKKDGSIAKVGSDVHTGEDRNILQEYIKTSIAELDKDIYSGKIDIMPYKKGQSTPCIFCDFKEVCLFEGQCYRYIKTKKDEAWYKIKEKLKGDDV